MGAWVFKRRMEIVKWVVTYGLCLLLLFFALSDFRPGTVAPVPGGVGTIVRLEANETPLGAPGAVEQETRKIFHDGQAYTVVYEEGTARYLVFGAWFVYKGYFTLAAGEDLNALTSKEIWDKMKE